MYILYMYSFVTMQFIHHLAIVLKEMCNSGDGYRCDINSRKYPVYRGVYSIVNKGGFTIIMKFMIQHYH